MPAPSPLPNFFDDPSIFSVFWMSVDEGSFRVTGPGWELPFPLGIAVSGKLVPKRSWDGDWIPIEADAALEMLTERRDKYHPRS